MISILVADDEEMIRTAIVALLELEEDLTVVAEASDGDAAIRLALEHRPEIALLDLEMPLSDGVDVAVALGRTVSSRVIIITRHSRPGVLRRALAAGVYGFVPKSTPVTRLATIIRDVAAGQRFVDSDIAAAALAAESCALTERELEVLRLTREHVSVRQISSQLNLAEGTVRNYLSSAMAKLNQPSRHAAAEAAWSHGWI